MLDELVTSAVQHGNGPIELRLRVDDDAGMLFGEVRDAGAVLPTRREAAPNDENGRGLALITALAASYGRQRIDGGEDLWFAQPSPCRRDPPRTRSGRRGQAVFWRSRRDAGVGWALSPQTPAARTSAEFADRPEPQPGSFRGSRGGIGLCSATG
jgi:hypothetical protein